MASKSSQLLVFTLLSLTLVLLMKASAESPTIPRVIRYMPMVDIPKAVGIAKFAVGDYNRGTDQKLIYEKVVKAEYAHFSASVIDYRLTIKTWTKENGLHSGKYVAVVSDELPEHLMKLISFKQV